MLNVQVSYH